MVSKNSNYLFHCYYEILFSSLQAYCFWWQLLIGLQAYVLKYLLFFSDDLSNPEISSPLYTLGQRRFYQSSFSAGDDFSSLTDDRKTRCGFLLLKDASDVSILLSLLVTITHYYLFNVFRMSHYFYFVHIGLLKYWYLNAMMHTDTNLEFLLYILSLR